MPQRIFRGDDPVIWTRGAGCAELAELLSPVPPVRADGDLVSLCVQTRADAVVSRRLSSNFDLVPQIVPDDFDLDGSTAIVAAVSGGPHSPLAASVAARLGESTGLPASMVCAYQDEEDQASALGLIQRLYHTVPELEYRIVQAEDATSLIDQLPDGATLVIGAPGGSWLQRTFFGQGARLIQAAAGSVVVHTAPRRAFQEMGEPVYVSPHLEAVDILRLHTERTMAVVDAGRVVGLVRREVLDLADPGVPVADLMEEAVTVLATDELEDCRDVWEKYAPDPVPVTDEEGNLLGGLTLS